MGIEVGVLFAEDKGPENGTDAPDTPMHLNLCHPHERTCGVTSDSITNNLEIKAPSDYLSPYS